MDGLVLGAIGAVVGVVVTLIWTSWGAPSAEPVPPQVENPALTAVEVERGTSAPPAEPLVLSPAEMRDDAPDWDDQEKGKTNAEIHAGFRVEG